MNTERIIDVLTSSCRPTITVAGDYCLDKYLYIDAKLDEPSVETGLTAYQVREERLYPGVGGTISANLQSLGAKVRAVGVYGDDGDGFELIKALNKQGIETSGMTLCPGRYTNTYMKPMRENASGVWTELNRMDIRNRLPVPELAVDQTLEQLRQAARTSEALIISDQFTYESGSVVTDRFRETVSLLHREFENLIILVDSRSYIEKYQNVLVKCNADELIKAVRRLEGDEEAQTVAVDNSAACQTERIERAAQKLSALNNRPVVVTRGARGSLVVSDGQIDYIPARKVEPPIDICGAGDATNAGLAFGLSLGLPLNEAAYLAGIVSSITIKQIGVTGTATVEQILAALRE